MSAAAIAIGGAGPRARLAALPAPLRAAALYAAAIAVAKGLSLAVLPVLTAHLSPAEFGRLELLASAAEIAALLLGAGLVDTLYRFATGAEARARAAAALGLALAASGLGLLLVLPLAAPIGTALPIAASAAEVALLGIAVAMGPVIAVGLAWQRMQGRAGRHAGVEIGRAVLQAGLGVGLVAAAGWGLAGVLAAGALAAVLAAAWLLRAMLAEVGLRLAPRAWGRMLAYGLPLTAGGLCAFALGTADRWILAGAVPAEALGQYALAAKLALVAAFLTQPFELWWYPRRLGLLAAPGGAMRSARAVGAGAALVLLAAGLAAVAGPAVIRLATPPAYHGAAALVPFLAAAIALQSLGSLLNVGCYTGRTGALPLLANGIAAVVALAGYVLLVPRVGVAGAIAATLAAQAVRLGVFLHLSQRRAPLPHRLGRVAALGMAVAAAAALPQAMAPGLAGAGAGAAALLAAAGLAVALGLLPRGRR